MGVDIGAQRRFWRDEQERKPGSCAPEGEEERADAFELNAASCAVLRCVYLCVHAVIIPGSGISDSGVRARSALDCGLGNGGRRHAGKEKASPWERRRMRLRGVRMQEALERGGGRRKASGVLEKTGLKRRGCSKSA